jgi:hypothetical protein
VPHHNYRTDLMGEADIEPKGSFEAGTWGSFTLTYTCGKFGIDDRGSIKIAFRSMTDLTAIQLGDPRAPGYTTIETSTGIPLTCAYESRRNIRPWGKSLYIRCNRFLTAGDTIIVRFGDTRQGSPGIRLQTFVEPTFEFRILVDPFGSYEYIPLPDDRQPTIAIIPGPGVNWKAILPTLKRPGEPFRLCLKCEDKWGNPSHQVGQTVRLDAGGKIKGLPETASIETGAFSAIIDNLTVEAEDDVTVKVYSTSGELLTVSNPLRLITNTAALHFWSDMHSQSEETIGTNSCREYFAFGRDKAFLDICGHQGNDFQITDAFWAELNRITRECNMPGTFLAIPGFEWSGNTSLGGDHNVWYREEGRPIYRSCRALVYDTEHPETDCHTARDLFKALQNEDAIVTAHIGGRYADVKYAHDSKIEPSVEIHSAWGTFEWVVRDAFEAQYRVGIVATSDGHKGRPGASYPGDAEFGSYGGLTCHLLPGLDRDSLFEGFRRRHHYATTGARLYLDTRVDLESEGTLYHRNPELGDVSSEPCTGAMMGDIVRTADHTVTFNVDVLGAAPIERIDLRDGLETIETVRPYDQGGLGNRIRIICEGAEYRGRGRLVHWDGTVEVEGAKIQRFQAINFWNIERLPEQETDNRIRWHCVTTGGYSAIDVWLDSATDGVLHIKTNVVECDIPLRDIGLEDIRYDCGGLYKALRVFRLPDELTVHRMGFDRTVKLRQDSDTRLFVRVTQEDGHQAWSSPIYLFR